MRDEDIAFAPEGVPFTDLMVLGTMTMMRKNGRFRALDRSEQIDRA